MDPELVSLGGMQNSGILSGVITFGKAAAFSRAFSGRFWPCGIPRKEELGRFPFSCDTLIFSKIHITVARQEILKGEKFEGEIHLQTHREEKVHEHPSWTHYCQAKHGERHSKQD